MSFQTCYSKVKKYVKESGLEKNIPEARLEFIARKLQNAAADSMTPSEFAKKAQDLVEGVLARESAARRAADAQTILLREKALKTLINNKEVFQKAIKEGKKDFLGALGGANDPLNMPAEAFKAWQIGGALRPGSETNRSPTLMRDRIKSKLWGTFRQALGSLEGITPSGVLDHDALMELDAIDRGTQKGLTQNPQALEYAKALKAVRDQVFSMEQSRNPFLMKAQNYLWMQVHDPARIEALGKDAWTQLAMKTFGDKSFPEMSAEDRVKKFEGLYDEIVSGKWNGRGGGNILARQAESRTLVANDARAFADYNAQAGPKTLYDGMDRILSQSAHDIAMMEKFGPSPDATRDQVLSKFKQNLSKAEYDRFKTQEVALDRQWNVLKGAQNVAPNTGAARLTSNALNVEYMAKAGAAIVHAAPGDLAISGNLLRQLEGSNVFSYAPALASEYAKGMASSSYRAARMEDLGLFAKAASMELMQAFGSPDETGLMGKAANVFGSVTMYNRHVDAMQSAIGTVLSRMLGRVSDTEFGALDKSWVQGLKRYGIRSPEWDVARMASKDGMIAPQYVQAVPDAAIVDYLKKSGRFSGEGSPSAEMMTRARDDIEIKLGTMINEHARLGTAHTDIRQRYFMWGDTNINEGMGIFRRIITQFKGSVITMSDVYRRGYLSGDGPKGDFAGMAQTMILAGFLSAVSRGAYELAKGKTPEQPTPANIAKWTIESGVLGAYGGILMGSMQGNKAQDKAYQGMNAVLGPIGGTIINAGAVGAQAIQERGGHTRRPDAGPAATKLLLQNIPGQSMIFTKSLFDYYFANQLREFAGPGYSRSVERAMHEEGRSYLWGKPTGQSFTEGD